MKSKKLYIVPKAEVVIMEPVTLLTASFSESLDSTDPVDDPEDIL